MSDYEMVVGVETHVQLKTATKLFCGCPVRFAAPPNSLVCPICLGHPGSLPALNREAVELAIRAGLALNGRIASSTKFDRKNYFYPDLPKNYQISQYDRPISEEGWIEILGAGMVHPEILENMGYDPGVYTGFAAGLGVERIDMLRRGVDDIRHYYENDLRFLSQF